MTRTCFMGVSREDYIRLGGSFGDVDPDISLALDAKLAELRAGHQAALDEIGIVASAQDAAYGSHSYYALEQVQKSIDLLSGDLYQAVLGQHVFPLDDGTAPDPAAALDIWNTLARDAQETLSGVLKYQRSWGPLPGFKSALPIVANPFNWPWYLQAAAGVAVLYYGAQFLGGIGAARSAFHGRRRRR